MEVRPLISEVHIKFFQLLGRNQARRAIGALAQHATCEMDPLSSEPILTLPT